MALIEINLDPSNRDLKWFGVLTFVFFLLIGNFVYWTTTATGIAYALWIAGSLFCTVYYFLQPMRKIMYRGWLRFFQPLGWIIGHALFAIIFFGVFALIRLGLRIFRHDPMQRRRRLDADTYWLSRSGDINSSRYFRQF